MSAHSPQPAGTDSVGTEDEFGRRGFLSRTAATGTALGGLLVAGDRVVPQFSPIGRAQAVAPIVIYGAVAGGSAAVGWALGEWDPLEDDSPPDGLGPSALHEQTYQTARTRQSTNRSTFVDNRNIAESGAEHAAYGDGKVAGIEALNEQKSQSEVVSAAHGGANDYEETILTNLFKSWKESVNEFMSMVETIESHDDLNLGDVLADTWTDITVLTETYEFENGNTFELPAIQLFDSLDETVAINSPTYYYIDHTTSEMFSSFEDTPSSMSVSATTNPVIDAPDSSDSVDYLSWMDWNPLYETLTDVFQSVRDGLTTWVDGVYSDIQSGELDTEDLITPRELAEMSADEEGVNQAIADLMALNVPVDLEREATISMDTENGSVTIAGMLAPTNPPEDGILSGETYDPETMDGDIYFNYDVSQGSAVWTGYDSAGVDGGVVTFTAEPYDETLYKINTGAGEEATVTADDFTPDSEENPTEWTVDVSDQLENAITEIEEVEMVAESGDTQYELIQLDRPFTVEKIENSNGEEVDKSTFTQNEPQDDTNYITEEEWEEMRKRNEELIRKYEEAKEDDDGLGIPSLDELADEYGGAFAGVIIVVVAISAAVGFVTNQIPGMGD